MAERIGNLANLEDPRLLQRDACGVGFIAQLHGKPSHQIVTDGLEILRRMDHRGGRAADGVSSDGAGIMTQIPDAYFRTEMQSFDITLPEQGRYAVGMFFLPREASENAHWRARLLHLAVSRQLHNIALRTVPVCTDVLGPIAAASQPLILQWFVEPRDKGMTAAQFDWQLYMVRKELEREAAVRYGLQQLIVYCASLSTETICYKGLIQAETMAAFYLDLQNPEYKSAFAMVHQRFSTNTLPAWPLAQPFRRICHNGEINTLRGNINAMHARSYMFQRLGLEADLAAMGPICVPGLSDSAMLDNTIEFLRLSGRTMPEVLSIVIPEPWEKHEQMPAALRDYYEYHSHLMEPWDGPAFIGFAEGKRIGACLDRNGLRPGRYWVTREGEVIMASEAGVVDRPAESILEKGRLRPGRMFVVDMQRGAIVPDAELKAELAAKQPYGRWLSRYRKHLEDLPVPTFAAYPEDSEEELQRRLRVFGYTREDLRVVIVPMAREGKEPVGSMGNDTPLAILSKDRPLLYSYFKQLFAQVTNPPIDALREELVTSLSTVLGAATNMLEESPEHARRLRLAQPILSDTDLQRLEFFADPHYRSTKIMMHYRAEEEDLASALKRLLEQAVDLVRDGVSILILSDRETDAKNVPIPALLATAAVHHELIRHGLRLRTSLLVETAEAREVHHFALLLGYGAEAVNPYLVLDVLSRRQHRYGLSATDSVATLHQRYIKAVGAGLLKVLSKMGISTLQSYRGAQIFEALGLSRALIAKYFTGTVSRLDGLGLSEIDAAQRWRHKKAYEQGNQKEELPEGGLYRWRREGALHMHHPEMIASLQKATRINSQQEFKRFCASIDAPDAGAVHLRSLLEFHQERAAVPLEEVEPVTSIVKRFATGAMSFGSLGKEAHESLAIAMNRIGARSNSGEGGEDADRFTPATNGDWRRSAVKQVASGRFGVTSHYLINADELQIKMAQGAKPGEGGQLPGDKVDAEIARVRHSTPGITLISPPPHHDIYSIEDLAQLIFDLKNANKEARISVKLVSEAGVGTIAAGVAKAKADVILIAGCEGGTGASPLSSIQHAGLPWELGLAEAQRSLVEKGLRGRVVLQADGQLRTPRDIAIATLLGAEEWGIGTGALIVMGCVMMRQCHLNTCPVGVATQDPELRKKFQGQPEHLINYIFMLAEGLRELMAGLGFRTIREMVGQVGSLKAAAKAEELGVDLEAILAAPYGYEAGAELVQTSAQDHGLEKIFDRRVLLPAFEAEGTQVKALVKNTDRSLGTMLSSEISRRHGAEGLSDGFFKIELEGSAGQSFMAFGAKGIRALLIGEANDYCGKGLSGAHVIIRPSAPMPGVWSEQVICGNVALYGATSGLVWIAGQAGERFAVRNSGAHAVVEGVGDHGCEYMTGGTVIVLGNIGRNFAAGMSGGYAYIYDKDGSAKAHINKEMVDVGICEEPEDQLFLQRQIGEHLRLTGSPLAKKLLENWPLTRRHFLSVVPSAYRDAMRDKRGEKQHAPEARVGATERVLEEIGHG